MLNEKDDCTGLNKILNQVQLYEDEQEELDAHLKCFRSCNNSKYDYSENSKFTTAMELSNDLSVIINCCDNLMDALDSDTHSVLLLSNPRNRYTSIDKGSEIIEQIHRFRSLVYTFRMEMSFKQQSINGDIGFGIFRKENNK